MSNLKSIRIVTPVYPKPRMPESGRFIANLAEAWSAQGIRIDVVAPKTLSDPIRGARKAPQNVDIPGVSVRYVRTGGTPFARRMPKALKSWLSSHDASRLSAALCEGDRPDVLYAQFASAGKLARNAWKTAGVPYVVDLGESHPLTGDKDRFARSRMRDIDEAEVASNRDVVRDAAGVVCVSPRLRDEAIALGADPSRVSLIPNFPNWDRFRPMDKADCRRKLGLDPDTFIAIYVGHFIWKKGAPRLNEALHKMRQPVQAVFMGSGAVVPDFPGIIHMGSVTHELMPVWMNAVDVMALPTLAEGCCNVIAEALACALPIVTSDIEDIRWQVPEKGVVLVDPNDTAALADALDALAADPARVAQMRADLTPLAQVDRDKNRGLAILSWMRELLDRDDG